jgi:hypothetical protein
LGLPNRALTTPQRQAPPLTGRLSQFQESGTGPDLIGSSHKRIPCETMSIMDA